MCSECWSYCERGVKAEWRIRPTATPRPFHLLPPFHTATHRRRFTLTLVISGRKRRDLHLALCLMQRDQL